MGWRQRIPSTISFLCVRSVEVERCFEMIHARSRHPVLWLILLCSSALATHAKAQSKFVGATPLAAPASELFMEGVSRRPAPIGLVEPQVTEEAGGSSWRSDFAGELGVGRLEIAEQDGPALAVRLRGSSSGELLGFGAELHLAGSIGDLGELDAPGFAWRLQPFVSVGTRSPLDEWAVRLRVGPEFVHFGAGDEVYAEFDGIGGRLDIDAQVRLMATKERVIEGFLGIGFGMGSGDAAAGISLAEVEFEDDYGTLDVELGLRFRSGGAAFTIGLMHHDVSLDEVDASYAFDGLMIGGMLIF